MCKWLKVTLSRGTQWARLNCGRLFLKTWKYLKSSKQRLFVQGVSVLKTSDIFKSLKRVFHNLVWPIEYLYLKWLLITYTKCRPCYVQINPWLCMTKFVAPTILAWFLACYPYIWVSIARTGIWSIMWDFLKKFLNLLWPNR